MKNLYYRVKKNDTLLTVSAKFYVPAAIIVADNLLNSEPNEGDILFIRKIEGRLYSVRPEDSAFSIAQRFGVSQTELLEKNKIPYVFAGEIIEI